MINDKRVIEELIDKYDSPLYIFRESDFIDNYHNFNNTLKACYDKYQLSYSYKTNYAPYICGLVKKLGAYAEVVSDMEYYIAKKVAYEDNHIIYNGPTKGKLSIEMLLNGGLLNVDNLDELNKICEVAEDNKNIKINIGLRLNINIGQKFVSRFGIDVDNGDLEKALLMVDKYKNLSIHGLHCHIGQSRTVDSWKRRAEIMVNIVDNYFKYINLKYIDLGSGMFARMEESFARQFGDVPEYGEYAEAIGTVFNNYYKDYSYEDKPILFTEPGTTLINSYIDFVSSIKAIKHIKGKDFVVLDSSKHNLGEVCILKKLPILIIDNDDDKQTLKDASFVGYTCLEHDVMYTGFNGQLGLNDYVVFGNVGGYSNVSKPPFISPNCAMISENGNLIKEKETFDDLLSTYRGYYE